MFLIMFRAGSSVELFGTSGVWRIATERSFETGSIMGSALELVASGSATSDTPYLDSMLLI